MERPDLLSEAGSLSEHQRGGNGTVTARSLVKLMPEVDEIVLDVPFFAPRLLV